MVCIYFRLVEDGRRAAEWIPMGLRESGCLLRSFNPATWGQRMRDFGIRGADGDTCCLHLLPASWEMCPFYRSRGAEGGKARERNEFGYPLQL